MTDRPECNSSLLLYTPRARLKNASLPHRGSQNLHIFHVFFINVSLSLRFFLRRLAPHLFHPVCLSCPHRCPRPFLFAFCLPTSLAQSFFASQRRVVRFHRFHLGCLNCYLYMSHLWGKVRNLGYDEKDTKCICDVLMYSQLRCGRIV